MPITVKSKSLGLEDGPALDSGEDVSESPRRMLRMPFCGTLLAYGGDDGIITARKKIDDDDDDDGADFQTILRLNDMIRAVAVSSDAKRIVVGCDDGSTMVYTFDNYQGDKDTSLHPFCQSLDSSKSNGDDDDNDNMLSQDFGFSSNLQFFAGPTFDLPIRDLKFIPSKETSAYWLAVAHESGLVLVNVTESSTLLERELEHDVNEHNAYSGVRGVDLLPEHNLMGTLSMDGRLCVWDVQKKTLIERESMTCIPKKDVGEIHGADPFDRSCRPVFCDLGDKSFALLTPGRLLPTVRKLEFVDSKPKLDTVEVENTDPDKGHVEPVVCMYYLGHEKDKPTTRYLLTSGRDSRLILWKWSAVLTKITPLETFHLSCAATDLLLQGSNVMVACSNGNYSVVNLAPHLPLSMFATARNTSVASNRVSTKDIVPEEPRKKISKKTAKPKSKTDQQSDDDSGSDFPDSNAAPTVANKNRVRFVDDEAAEDDDDDDDDDNNARNGKDHDKKTSKSNDDGAFHSDDDSLEERRPARRTMEDLDDAMADLEDDLPSYSRTVASARFSKTFIPPQPAFSPSSTPLDLARRFLCWNHIGAITILQGEDRNTVDISFTDSAFKRPINFTDNMNFILGSLGEDGGIFATDLQTDELDENDPMDGLEDLNMSESTKRAVRKSQRKGSGTAATGSAIFFYRFATIGSLREKDWYLTLPVGERVWGAATGSGWAAVVTSRRFLRFFSAGGNQGQLVWLKGDAVTMAGRGRFLGVVHHDSRPWADGTQQLAYTLWDASTFDVLARGPVSCLSKGASLTWLGFSNDSSLMALDSEGMLSMLVQAGLGNWEWVPVLDTIGLRKSMEDSFWPITVYDGKLVCVPLKGGNTYPDAARRPVTSTLGLRLPLAPGAIGGKTAMLEEINVRSNLALVQKRFIGEFEGEKDGQEHDILKMTAQVDKVTLKLFAALVESNKVERALDLIDRLHLEMSYDLAIRIADRHDKLADMIEEAKYRKFPADPEGDVEDDNEGYSEDEDEGRQYSPEATKFMDRLTPQISPEAEENGKRTNRSQGNAFQHMMSKKQRVS